MSDMQGRIAPERLGIGAIVGDTFSILFSRFFHILLLSLLPTIAMVIAALLVIVPIAMAQSTPDKIATLGVAAVIPLFVIVFAVYFLTTALIVRLAYDARAGNPMRLGSYFGSALRAILPILGCSIVVAIGSFAAMMAVGMPGFLLGEFFSVLFAIPSVLAGLYVYASWCAVTPAIVIERAGFGALRRSMDLTRNYRWACVGAIVVMFLCLLVVLFGVGIVQLIIVSIAGQAVGTVVSVLTNGLTVGFTGIFTALLYARLREIKEGTSVEQLAEVFA
jgi:hypothetical protein